jgi:hypothetical protein
MLLSLPSYVGDVVMSWTFRHESRWHSKLFWLSIRATKNKSRKSGERRVRQNKSSADREILNSQKSTGSTTTVVVSDLSMKRQNFNLIERPPRQIGNQTFWCKLMYDEPLSLSTIAASNEYNRAFLGSNFNGFSSAASFFDQYCIYSVTINVTSLMVSASYGAAQCYTAIDYDSVANIGKVGIQAFSSCNYSAIGADATSAVTRFLKPCIAPQVTSSNLPVAGGVARAWLDCAYPSVQHYGLRMLFDAFSANVSNGIHVAYSAVFGFRNNL